MKKGYLVLIGFIILALLFTFACKKTSLDKIIPAEWDGDYALKSIPETKALAVHDGKIFTVLDDKETELFPAAYPDSGYKIKSSKSEVKASFNEAYVKFMSKDGMLTMETTGGAKIEYIKIEK